MPPVFRQKSALEKSGPEAIDKFQEFFEAPTFPIAHQAFISLLEILEIEAGQSKHFFHN